MPAVRNSTVKVFDSRAFLVGDWERVFGGPPRAFTPQYFLFYFV